MRSYALSDEDIQTIAVALEDNAERMMAQQEATHYYTPNELRDAVRRRRSVRQALEVADTEPAPTITYTVIGVWVNDAAMVAGVVEGTIQLVDSFTPDNDGDFGRWSEIVDATSPNEAEAMAIASIEAQERQFNQEDKSTDA